MYLLTIRNIVKNKLFQYFCARRLFNSFHTTGLFLYPLKTSEKVRFSHVSRGYSRDQRHEIVTHLFLADPSKGSIGNVTASTIIANISA